MARWRLTAAHYLNVEGTEWEYKETSQLTGKSVRKVYPVPTYLDPDNPGDWTTRTGPTSGMLVVSDGEDAQPSDIIFQGHPTPDMEPLDDAAREISAQYHWAHPINDLPATGGSYAEDMIRQMQTQMEDIKTATQQAAPIKGMDELLSFLSLMMKQNQQILEHLTARSE